MSGLTISKLAAAAGVGVPTVRYYERRGLLPKPQRRASGYRDFDHASVRRIRFIRQAKELGFTLRDVSALLKLRVTPGSDCAAVRARAAGKLAEVTARLAELERIRDALAKLVAACPAGGPVTHCTILDALEAPVARPSSARGRAGRRRKNGTDDMKSLELQIEGMHCDGCASTIEALLAHHPGVKSAAISFDAGKGRILYDPSVTNPAGIAAAIEQAGYRVKRDSGAAR